MSELELISDQFEDYVDSICKLISDFTILNHN
jgi:hypothetical protein